MHCYSNNNPCGYRSTNFSITYEVWLSSSENVHSNRLCQDLIARPNNLHSLLVYIADIQLFLSRPVHCSGPCRPQLSALRLGSRRLADTPHARQPTCRSSPPSSPIYIPCLSSLSRRFLGHLTRHSRLLFFRDAHASLLLISAPESIHGRTVQHFTCKSELNQSTGKSGSA